MSSYTRRVSSNEASHLLKSVASCVKRSPESNNVYIDWEEATKLWDEYLDENDLNERGTVSSLQTFIRRQIKKYENVSYRTGPKFPNHHILITLIKSLQRWPQELSEEELRAFSKAVYTTLFFENGLKYNLTEILRIHTEWRRQHNITDGEISHRWVDCMIQRSLRKCSLYLKNNRDIQHSYLLFWKHISKTNSIADAKTLLSSLPADALEAQILAPVETNRNVEASKPKDELPNHSSCDKRSNNKRNSDTSARASQQDTTNVSPDNNDYSLAVIPCEATDIIPSSLHFENDESETRALDNSSKAQPKPTKIKTESFRSPFSTPYPMHISSSRASSSSKIPSKISSLSQVNTTQSHDQDMLSSKIYRLSTSLAMVPVSRSSTETASYPRTRSYFKQYKPLVDSEGTPIFLCDENADVILVEDWPAPDSPTDRTLEDLYPSLIPVSSHALLSLRKNSDDRAHSQQANLPNPMQFHLENGSAKEFSKLKESSRSHKKLKTNNSHKRKPPSTSEDTPGNELSEPEGQSFLHRALKGSFQNRSSTTLRSVSALDWENNTSIRGAIAIEDEPADKRSESSNSESRLKKRRTVDSLSSCWNDDKTNDTYINNDHDGVSNGNITVPDVNGKDNGHDKGISHGTQGGSNEEDTSVANPKRTPTIKLYIHKPKYFVTLKILSERIDKLLHSYEISKLCLSPETNHMTKSLSKRKLSQHQTVPQETSSSNINYSPGNSDGQQPMSDSGFPSWEHANSDVETDTNISRDVTTSAHGSPSAKESSSSTSVPDSSESDNTSNTLVGLEPEQAKQLLLFGSAGPRYQYKGRKYGANAPATSTVVSTALEHQYSEVTLEQQFDSQIFEYLNDVLDDYTAQERLILYAELSYKPYSIALHKTVGLFKHNTEKLKEVLNLIIFNSQ